MCLQDKLNELLMGDELYFSLVFFIIESTTLSNALSILSVDLPIIFPGQGFWSATFYSWAGQKPLNLERWCHLYQNIQKSTVITLWVGFCRQCFVHNLSQRMRFGLEPTKIFLFVPTVVQLWSCYQSFSSTCNYLLLWNNCITAVF